jgi:ABC-type dipeptide/oligopeptide/nickel transport system ATPase subunit
VSENADLQRIVQVGRSVLSRFALTIAGDLRQTGLIRSLTSSESIFELPSELQRFKPLMDKEYKVDWVGWKHDGSKYDDTGICPFCTVNLSGEYESEKKTFTASYTSSNVKNIIEMLSYFDAVKDFMDDAKKEKLEQCIKKTEDEPEIQLWVKRFYLELKFLVERLTSVMEFNSYQVRSEDISRLDDQLRKLVIDVSDLEIFNNRKVTDLIEFVNQKISVVLSETDSLKRDIGDLKGLIDSSKRRAITDMNDFLATAGINYKIEIADESEGVAKTILKYVSKTDDLIDVDNINLHLSWGERNAFALVLFMHWALSQDPDIIILDDPISSFDSNKKYAIINRLFSSVKNSFFKKTVLMLTHDLQPIIDCLVNNKPRSESVSACFLQCKDGVISEQEITGDDVKPLPKLLADSAGNEELNIVHRVASLRKLFEHIPSSNPAQDQAYDLLSCLLHGRTKPTRKDGTELSDEQITSGEEFIAGYIMDFKYTHYSTNVFTRDSLLKIFNEETNSYSRLQVFRVLLEALDLRSKIEDPLLKYIDEQFHVENDYMFDLDFMKYDIVPDFVIPKCCEHLRKERLIS